MKPLLLRKREGLLKDKDNGSAPPSVELGQFRSFALASCEANPGANPQGKSERSSSCPMAAPAGL